MKSARRLLLAGVGAGALLLRAAASLADAAAGEALFREGRALMQQGNIAAACQKFSESQRLDPSTGTLLNLANCETQLGRPASAWADFLAAARMAKQQGDAAREDEARRRARELEPSLSYITITVRSSPAGLEIHRDDTVVQAGSLGSPLPVDPGTHAVSASAPGFKPWQKTVEVAKGGARVQIEIPDLEPLPKSAAAPEATLPLASSPPAGTGEKARSSKALPYALGGLGIVSVGVGTFFGLRALSTYKKADDACPSHQRCAPSAVDDASAANTQANVANIALGLGVVSLGVGAYLLLTNKDPAGTPAAPVSAEVAPGYMGLRVGGRL
jgi:tetratricopeptide (TPR) repeat protein